MSKSIFLAVLSDMHSGSPHALYPNRALFLKTLAYTSPNEYQQALYDHFIKCAEFVKEKRKGKDLILVHNGDATEGIHHNSLDHISPRMEDHIMIHVELMEDFRKAAGVKASDRMYYVSGTESHTGDLEEEIAKHFDTEPAAEIGGKVLRLHHELQLIEHGRRIWFTHHGVASGKGANEGNSMRNWMRDIYWDSKRAGSPPPPDLIYTAHHHKSNYTTYVQDWHTIHGVTLPSWQRKTRYALKVAPFQRNDIGMAFSEISPDGDIRIYPSMVMQA